AFFVPVVHLVTGYLAVRDIWKASSPAAQGRWRETPVSPILGVWWACWVVGGLLHYSPLEVLNGHWSLEGVTSYPSFVAASRVAAGRSSGFGTRSFNALLEFSWGLLVSEVVAIAGSVLAAVVVVRITDLQGQRWLEVVGRDPPSDPVAGRAED